MLRLYGTKHSAFGLSSCFAIFRLNCDLPVVDGVARWFNQDKPLSIPMPLVKILTKIRQASNTNIYGRRRA